MSDGYCLYHEQDLSRAISKENPSLYIAFQKINNEDDKVSIEVGKKVVGVLKKHGFEVDWNESATTKIHIPNLGLPSTPVMSQLLCGVAFWVTCPKHEHNFQCNLMKLPGSNDICIASKSLFLHIGCVSSKGGKYTHLACFLYLGKQHKWNTWWNLVA
jgi:hypothetical protein